MTRRSAVVLLLLALLLLTGCASTSSASKYPVNRPTGLVFATYNVHWLSDADRLREDLARLDFVSVWAFQEVRSTREDEAQGLPSRLMNILPPGGWHIAWVPLNPLNELNRPQEREGQVIASRYPILSTEVWELKRAGDKRRLALVAVLDIDGRSVRFVNTDHEPSIMSFTRGNVRQVKSLVDQLDQHNDMPTIVAGDFNTSGCLLRFVSSSKDCAELRRAMKGVEFDEAEHPNHSSTFHAPFYDATLDHLFVRGVATDASGVDERARGSDHLPVWCEVHFAGAKASGGATSAPSGALNPTR